MAGWPVEGRGRNGMAGRAALFRVPAQITLGPGAAETVGTEAKRLGATRAFVVSDPTLYKLGVTDRILASLSAQEIQASVYTELEFEPSVGCVPPAAAAARDLRCELVVGLGGGTTLDTAKAVAMLTRNDGSVEDYLGIGLV